MTETDMLSNEVKFKSCTLLKEISNHLVTVYCCIVDPCFKENLPSTKQPTKSFAYFCIMCQIFYGIKEMMKGKLMKAIFFTKYQIYNVQKTQIKH